MSNMDTITKKIKKSVSKKKMSLSKDYNSQLTGTPAKQQAIDNTQVKQGTGKTASQYAVADAPASQQADASATARPSASNKKKITFYCGKEEEKMLMDLYIKILKKGNKKDKSALICEGIRLLYAHTNEG